MLVATIFKTKDTSLTMSDQNEHNGSKKSQQNKGKKKQKPTTNTNKTMHQYFTSSKTNSEVISMGDAACENSLSSNQETLNETTPAQETPLSSEGSDVLKVEEISSTTIIQQGDGVSSTTTTQESERVSARRSTRERSNHSYREVDERADERGMKKSELFCDGEKEIKSASKPKKNTPDKKSAELKHQSMSESASGAPSTDSSCGAPVISLVDSPASSPNEQSGRETVGVVNLVSEDEQSPRNAESISKASRGPQAAAFPIFSRSPSAPAPPANKKKSSSDPTESTGCGKVSNKKRRTGEPKASATERNRVGGKASPVASSAPEDTSVSSDMGAGVTNRRSSRERKSTTSEEVNSSGDDDFEPDGRGGKEGKSACSGKKQKTTGKKPGIFMTKKEKEEIEAAKRKEEEASREKESLARYQAERERSRLATKQFFKASASTAASLSSANTAAFFSVRKRPSAAQYSGRTGGGECTDREKVDPVTAAKEQMALMFPEVQHVNAESKDPVETVQRPVLSVATRLQNILSEDLLHYPSDGLLAPSSTPVGRLASIRDITASKSDTQVLSLRSEWVKFVLRKSCASGVVGSQRVDECLEVIEVEESARIQPLSLDSLHLSMSNVLAELHNTSLNEHEEPSVGQSARKVPPSSMLAAELQFTSWLSQWIARYDKPVPVMEVAPETTRSGSGLRSRNNSVSSRRTQGRRGRRVCHSSDEEDCSDFGEEEAEFSDYEPSRKGLQGGGMARGMGELSNVVIISGPRGSLKTSLVHAGATRCGFTVIELNASHERNGTNIRKLVSEASQSKGLKGMAAAVGGAESGEATGGVTGGKMNLILFDEADIYFKDDLGFISTIHQLSKSSKCPLVITMRSMDSSLLSGFHMDPLQISLRPPGFDELGRLLFTLVNESERLQRYGVSISLQDAVDLAVVCDGDIRSCFNTLLCLDFPLKSKDVTLCEEITRCRQDFKQWLVQKKVLGSPLDLYECDNLEENVSFQPKSSEEEKCITLPTAVYQATSSVLSYLPCQTASASKKDNEVPEDSEVGLDDEDQDQLQAEEELDSVPEAKVTEEESVVVVPPLCCDDANDGILFTPIILSIEPRNIDIWKGGNISINGKNFLQRKHYRDAATIGENSGIFADVVVSVGGTEYRDSAVLCSDNEIGLNLPPLLRKPDSADIQNWEYNSKRAPKQVELVEVSVTFGDGASKRCLSSSMCGMEKAWVCYMDSRAPDEIQTPPAPTRPPLPVRKPSRGKKSRKRYRKKSSSLSTTGTPSSAVSSDCESVQTNASEDGESNSTGGALSRAIDSDDDFEEDKGYEKMIASKRQRVVDDSDDDNDDFESDRPSKREGGMRIADDEGEEYVSIPPLHDANTGASALNSVETPVDIESVMRQVVESLSAHKLAGPFLTPINPVEHPSYNACVSSPMDVGTIASSIEENLYDTIDEFLQDINQIWTNCLLFDGFSEDIRNAAIELQTFVNGVFDDIMTNPPLLSVEEGDVLSKAEENNSPGETAKELTAPPSPSELLTLLEKAEKGRLTSRGNVINTFFSEEVVPTDVAFNRADCFRMSLGESSEGRIESRASAEEDLQSLENICKFLDVSSDADIVRGLVDAFDEDALLGESLSCGGSCNVPLATVRYTDDCGILPRLNVSAVAIEDDGIGSVVATTGVVAEDEGLTHTNTWCLSFSEMLLAVADSFLAIGYSLFSDSMSPPYAEAKRHLPESGALSRSEDCLEVKPCASLLTRPRMKLERNRFLDECFMNIAPNRWPSNGANSSSLRPSLALDVLPQLAVMLQAQSPEKMESNALQSMQQEEGMYRRSTRAASMRSPVVQRSYTRVATLLQIPDSMLEKLAFVLPLPAAERYQ